jgi:hypothetical protein
MIDRLPLEAVLEIERSLLVAKAVVGRLVHYWEWQWFLACEFPVRVSGQGRPHEPGV